MKYPLFISDFDNTLGHAPGNIADEDILAIREFSAKGGKFVICTGRMFSSIRQICKKYSLKGLVVSYQGAMINDIETGDSLFSSGIEYNLATDVVKRLMSEGFDTMVDINDTLYFDRRTPLTEFYEKATDIRGLLINSVPNFLQEQKKIVLKVCGLGDKDMVESVVDKLNDEYCGQVIFNSGSSHLIEVVNPTCSKGVAVKFIADYYNIPYNQTIAVGDSTNDIELLNGAWHGVAVGDAKDALKKIAKEITVPYAQHPVSTLLKKYCL